MNGIEFLESVSQLGQIILLFSGYALYWKLGKIKKERKLTKYETFLRLFVMFGIFAWALSFLALHLW
ncbi:hypothetical protein [Bacillus subtilis]|uniref:hypothetical protein n=1 Tax=Bacillus subtilis TaxID=1423 RepID=UPI0002C4E88F|nr:hypothetical protein [Bacillus subtilis]AGI28472.1 hypothetical protein I653_06080 [Bacillus subtilis subsp. subtilis str. BAB-1]AKD34586.1 hypothetical protein AW03_011940 [Bacillus subtilis HJ5]ALS82647.1 hypothetical protein AT706_12145 [Bacillus subtilis subsp. subtilis]ASK23230.1 hypothetical protein BSSX_1335 [Bacillus subtilis]MCL9625134.1 hypothetical protein [Bacillus subtilis]